MGLSCAPRNFVESGGKFDDYVGLIKKARFELWDYNGKFPKAPFYHMTVEMEDGYVTEEYITIGDAKLYFPTADGMEVNGTKEISPSSNFGILMGSFVNVGFSEDVLDTNPTTGVEGTKFHFQRVAPPENRKEMKKKEGKDEKASPVLIATELISLPGEAKAKAVGASVDAVKGKVTAIITQLLNEAKGKTLTKVALTPGLVAKCAGDSDQGAMIGIALSDDFLHAGPWAYKDGVLSL